MNPWLWRVHILIVLQFIWCHADSDGAGTAGRPNVLFLLVDDLGWADIGANGSEFYLTPNIDQLARSGTRFSQAYAAGSVCSPTRASILTGKHPVRVDITDWIPGSRAGAQQNPRFHHIDDRDHLDLAESTLAEILMEQGGYATFFAGKWHLGGQGSLPTDHGFQINVGGFAKGSPPGGYYAPFENPYLPDQSDGEYLTERLTRETIRFMETDRKDQPFLAYLAYYNVHTPIQPYKKQHPEFIARRQSLYGDSTSDPITEHEGLSRTRQDNPEYASMIAAVDESVGQLIQSLHNSGQFNNTVIFFTSDNGGLCTLRQPGPTSNFPLRSGKGWLYEGGIRIPLIVRVPGQPLSGSVCHDPVYTADFLPTILELCHIDFSSGKPIDGRGFLPLIRGAGSMPPRNLYWHYPHYHGSTWTPGAAIRSGQWKLIEFYEWNQFELYNLQSDPGESENLAAAYPSIANQLRSELSQWQTSLHARMPVPINPQQP